MAGQSAADTMSEVARVGAARKGQEVPEEMLEQQAAAIRAHFDAQEDAFYTSGRVLDHGIIDPRDTRKVLAFCWRRYLRLVCVKHGRTLRRSEDVIMATLPETKHWP